MNLLLEFYCVFAGFEVTGAGDAGALAGAGKLDFAASGSFPADSLTCIAK